jgi:hypothetical protein
MINNNNKKVYKRNWKKINYGNTKKMEILFDKKVLKYEKLRLKEQNYNKEGAKFKYSDLLIETILYIKYFFNIDFRKTMSFLKIFKKMIKFPVPDYTTLSRRQSRLNVFLKNISKKRKTLRVAIDGSGFSKTNRAEWLRLVHKKGKIGTRNGFVKVVIVADVDTKEILDIQIFDDSTGENKCTKQAIENTIKNKNQTIDVFFGDGAYDSYENFHMLNDLNIKPVISVRKNSRRTLLESKVLQRRRNLNKININTKYRTKVVNEQLKDKNKWKKDNDYGMRWAVEGVFSSLKRRFGDCVVSKRKNVAKELMLKANLYNLIINT